MPESNTVYAPQRRYSDKQKKLGLTKVTMWVPEASRERALKYGAKLRRDHDAAE